MEVMIIRLTDVFPCHLVGKAFGFKKHQVILNEDAMIAHAQLSLISGVTQQLYLYL